MEFGKRSGEALQAALRSLHGFNLRAGALAKPAAGRKQIAATALAGVVLGFGGVTAGTTFVHASERAGLLGLFDTLFGAPQRPQPVAEPRRAPKRYSSLPDARRVSATRTRHFTPRPVAALPDLRGRACGPMRPASAGVAAGVAASVAPAVAAGVAPVAYGTPQTVCVRTCDGYLFPLGRLASRNDLPVHAAACAAACPNAQTALFTLPAGRSELEQAVSLKGQPYLAAAWANVYRQKRVQNCSCQPPGVAAMPLAIGSDPTVRVGDVVATEAGANVVTTLVRGQVGVGDYRYARNLSRSARADIDRRVGAIRRDTAEAAFRRSLRVADAKADTKTVRVRLAEAGTARIRSIEAAPGFTAIEPTPDAERSLTPVRVVAP